ncbi:hypothetical protein [Lysinibacillus xylanilyticus]|uniref:Uncharacterized protein n=1 Tax=Lysinibacillus xylanilyticus TaxID=582475 RepID=A0A2M9Q755_9BACI|nr:hypothetical protein [Lysinibacillus xylanilyticus]PJO43905.1 hypothetical protein CWD94_09950 [Lysinibacillus xylanilyticus]
MDLKFLVSVSNFLNAIIQLLLLYIAGRIIYIYAKGGNEYISQPWILFISIGVAILYFINVGYSSIKRVEYIDTKLLNIDLLYIFSLLILSVVVFVLIKSFNTVESAISDAASLLVLTITIATNFWAPKITKILCRIVLK